jgi:hypothetical protein
MSDIFFHTKTYRLYQRLDDDVCFLWEDRNKDLAFAKQFYPVMDLKERAVFIIECDDFYEGFFPVEEDDFDELHKDFDFDELALRKLKKEFMKLVKGK